MVQQKEQQMGDEYNVKLCDERYGHLYDGIKRLREDDIKELKANIQQLYNRLNWFYVFLLITLGAFVADLVVGRINHKSDSSEHVAVLDGVTR